MSKKQGPETLADVLPDALYTPEEAARVLRLTLGSVYRLAGSGSLTPSRLGPRKGSTRFLGRVLIQYAQPDGKAA